LTDLPGRCRFCGAALVFRGQTTCQSCGREQSAAPPGPGTWWPVGGPRETTPASSPPALAPGTPPDRARGIAAAPADLTAAQVPFAPAAPAWGSPPTPPAWPPTPPGWPPAPPAWPPGILPGWGVPPAWTAPPDPRASQTWAAPANVPASAWQPPVPPWGHGPLPLDSWQGGIAFAAGAPTAPRRLTRQRAAGIAAAISLVVAVVVFAASNAGPPPGSFVRTGSMSWQRYMQTATRLQDGRVLMAGGEDSNGTDLNSAEIYDPSTGTFSPTGRMNTARSDARAVLLHDGRVLIVGGRSALAANTSDMFDPVLGRFSEASPPPRGCIDCTLTLLQDGRVLLAGGMGSMYDVNDAAYLFDPGMNSFSVAKGHLTAPRYRHTATRLEDGRVLLAGGWGRAGDLLASAEIFDPATGQFHATAPMAVGRQAHAAALLGDGRVLIAAGMAENLGSGSLLASAEIFDPSLEAFSSTGPMTTQRALAACATLVDGRVLIVGGTGGSDNDRTAFALQSSEVFDPAKGVFTTTAPLPEAAIGPTLTLLRDGRVLAAGGGADNLSEAGAVLYIP
jgi:hypothetical protein